MKHILANGFSTNNLLDICQEIIMVISEKKSKKKKVAIRKNLIILQSIGIIVTKQGCVIAYACKYSSGHLIPIIQSCQED